MPFEWSGLGPDLLVSLDRSGSSPVGTQLQVVLRAAIRDGRLRVDERLPSSRKWAADLGVSRGTVQSVYEQLEAEGYLRAVGGSGTRVASVGTSTASAPAAPRTPSVAVDLSPGRPDLRTFPTRDWTWAFAEATRTAAWHDLGYGDAQGSERLREVLAAYLGRVRGAGVDPGTLTVTAGFTQGLNLVLASLKQPKSAKIAVEDPGHPDMSRQVRAAGLEPVGIRVDADGLVVYELETSGAVAVILTPAHQTPTGVVLTPERRLALLDWARRVDGLVIEDDYDSEFRYDKQAVGALQGLGADRVVLLGSVSKSLAPAIRLGWVAAPWWLTTLIANGKQAQDWGSPTIDQLALANLIESGRFDRHLRRMRHVYSTRRHALVEALHEHAPDMRLTGLDAGFHALGMLPDHLDEQDVVDQARVRGVGVHGLSRYRSRPDRMPPGIVFGFGNVSDAALRRGIGAIGDLLRGDRR